MAQCTEFGYDVEHTVIRPYTEQKKLQALNALKTRMDGYHTYENVQVCGYVSKVWEFDVMNIKEYDRSNGVMEFHNESIRGFVNVDLQQQAYINNVSEELDDAGEYWIDPATKTLYVYKPQGNYSITTDGTFLTIQKRVNNISLVKLNFRICNNDGIIAHGDNFTMDQCSVTYVGGTHALYSEEALNVHITSSTFAYCAETGVNVEGPEPGDREDHDYYALQNTGFVFDNNVIHDVNLVYVPVESGGIKVRWQIGAVVSHNEIYNSGRYGVDYKYGNIDCIFEYNYLHHCMQNSADGGAFYCGRVAINRGNVIRYNLVADIYATNPIHTGGTYAIYLDDAMENLICYGNVFYNSGTIMNNNGRGHDIHDNVFIGNTGIFGKAGYYDISKYHYGVWGNENWSNITRIPDESTPNGKLWKERWPELYDILAICKDPDIDVTKLDLYTKPLNICCDNYFFGDGIDNNFFDEWLELSIHENNVELGEDVNPFFEDPTHGDYSITDTSKIGDNFYDKIGRY
ncbi:MAG: right-handed parallel beta-helix repeat-containing protein, partial [Clostridia bacterium]|nr:right-handed parallel beta-helix repeat-containing protein [Clostridia bacterium]